jgi:hypothetical protein
MTKSISFSSCFFYPPIGWVMVVSFLYHRKVGNIFGWKWNKIEGIWEFGGDY